MNISRVPTARRWGISRNTVKAWLNRYRKIGNAGLKDQRAGPKHIPHKTSEEVTQQVIQSRQQGLVMAHVDCSIFLTFLVRQEPLLAF